MTFIEVTGLKSGRKILVNLNHVIGVERNNVDETVIQMPYDSVPEVKVKETYNEVKDMISFFQMERL